jgi:hypothetical protein
VTRTLASVATPAPDSRQEEVVPSEWKSNRQRMKETKKKKKKTKKKQPQSENGSEAEERRRRLGHG